MFVEKETEKGLLIVLDAVPFWIQKRWLKADGTLTPAGWKAYYIAKRKHWQHFGFDALKEFQAVQETEKAVLLRCVIEQPGCPAEAYTEFWLPRSMTGNWNFVARKIKEIEQAFPFVGTCVRWSGRAAPSVHIDRGNYPPGRRGSATSGGFPPSNLECPGDFI